MKEILENKFLFKQLIKRDFKKKYKGTVLGVIWSLLYPLCDLLILVLIFTRLLGRDTPHYPVYVFCGTIILTCFKQATRESLSVFRENRNIITKIKMPNHFFVISRNVSAIINFCFVFIAFIIICIIDKINFGFSIVLLVYPVICLFLFNIGIGFILSVLYVFFKDIMYLYDLLIVIINYLSATFYSISSFPAFFQNLFYCNPLFCYIQYFRSIVVYNEIPSFGLHFLCLLYALVFLAIGVFVYKSNRKKLVYNL